MAGVCKLASCRKPFVGQAGQEYCCRRHEVERNNALHLERSKARRINRKEKI